MPHAPSVPEPVAQPAQECLEGSGDHGVVLLVQKSPLWDWVLLVGQPQSCRLVTPLWKQDHVLGCPGGPNCLYRPRMEGAA